MRGKRTQAPPRLTTDPTTCAQLRALVRDHLAQIAEWRDDDRQGAADAMDLLDRFEEAARQIVAGSDRRPAWIVVAAERIGAGEPTEAVLADYGWTREREVATVRALLAECRPVVEWSASSGVRGETLAPGSDLLARIDAIPGLVPERDR